MTEYLTYREEARRDRAERARLDMERDAARVELRMIEKRAAADFKREQAQAKADARERARAARSARFAVVTRWLGDHTTDLLFVPVILVPALLAWSAMAVYGAHLYGPAGWALPAFSEGAMWAFAAAVTITLRRHPGRPVWHLRVGIAVFALFGAVLNFLHGYAAGGPVVGVVMALVSVAGVVAHQLVHAGPRRSRAERDEARFNRAAGRRERRARRAALRSTTADMDSRGRARLVYRSGPATMERRWFRTVLVPVEHPRLMLTAAPVVAVETDETATVAPTATVSDTVTDAPAAALQEPAARLDAAAFVTRLSTLLDADETRHDVAPEWTQEAPAAATARPVFVAPVVVPADSETAARDAMRASYMAGNPRTVNSLQTAFGLTRGKAQKIRREVIEADGRDVLATASADES